MSSQIYKRIREEVDVMDVIEYFDLEYVVKGSYVFIECPEHKKNTGHEDSNIGNCVIHENGYHCFSCGANGDTISLISNHLGVSYRDAAYQIAAAFGISVNEEYSFLPLTRDELNSLHLTSTAKIAVPLSYGEKKDGFFDGQGYIRCKNYSENLADFYKENKAVFFEIVRGKVSEWQPIYEQLIRDLTSVLKKNGPEMALLTELEEVKADLRNLRNVSFKIAHGMI